MASLVIEEVTRVRLLLPVDVVIQYVLVRLVKQFVPTVLIASVVIFALIDILPGDPAVIALGPSATPEAVTAMRHEMGLDRPFAVRYFSWLADAFRGNFGLSTTGVTVNKLLRGTLPVTVELALVAFALGNLGGIALGVVAGANHGKLLDIVIGVATTCALAIPSFVAGLLLLLAFSVQLGWLPSAGEVAFTQNPVEAAKHLVLPAFALALPIIGYISRFTRQSLVDTLTYDFVRTARAKGLSERVVVFRHALKPSLIPVLTIVGIQLGGLLGGAIVIEQVFTWPGMGRLLIGSVSQKDYPTIETITLLLVAAYLIFNLLTDLAYAWADPRLRSALSGRQTR